MVSAPLSKYIRFHTRICRPVGLTEADCALVCAYAVERIGFAYDLKNIIDLMRYLLPLPVPQRWRRRLIALGSGDPTRLICSALIADAFRAVRYPILPKIRLTGSRQAREEILEIRHSSLYCPRDFDISPYFNVVKPTIARGFDYKALRWADPSPASPMRRKFRSCRSSGRIATRRSDSRRLIARSRSCVALCLARSPSSTSAACGEGLHARRRDPSDYPDVLAAAARGAVEIDRAGAGTDRRRRHRA